MPALKLVLDSLPVLLQGMLLTVKFAVWSMGFGLLVGLLVALMGISGQRGGGPARGYVSIMRGTPCWCRSSSSTTACRASASRWNRLRPAC